MRAVVRDIGDRFADALCAVPARIDVALARQQHAAYRATLASLGVDVIVLPADDAFPDGCFVEDTAVIAGGVALVTRPGAPSRRGEPAAITAVLAGYLEIASMTEPATLDGGDCMRVGQTIFVGRSARTNAAGIARLAEVFEPRGMRVVPVDMPPGVLHLKCVCAPLPDGRITLSEPSLQLDVDAIHLPEEESYAANVLAVGDQVVMARGFPRSRAALEAAGYTPIELDTSEVRKADGALTCLSLLF